MSVKKIHLFPSEESYVANSGSVEADDLALVPLNLSFNDLSDKPKAYVTQAWRSGTQWYRSWSNGWIEQGGHGNGNTCTFPIVFSNTNYTFVVQHSSGYDSHPDWIACYENRTNRMTSTTGITTYEDNSGWDWYACGY